VVRILVVASPEGPRELAVVEGVAARLGHEAALAASLDDACRRVLHERAFDVAFLDARAGPGPIRGLRALPRGEAPRLVAVIPAADAPRAGELVEAGADAVLTAPLDAAQVVAACAVAARAAQRAVQRPSDLLDPADRYEILFARNPHPMWFYDLDTLEFLAVNAAAVERYGWTQEEFRGLTLRDIRPPEDVPALLESMGRLQAGVGRPGVFRHRARDGREFHVEILEHPTSFGGRPAGLITAIDVSERIALEARLAGAERLAALGTLAAGIAHEVNNPLSWVVANLAIARERVDALREGAPGADAAGALADALADAAEGAERVRRIVHDLRAFSRSDAERRGPVDVAGAARTALNIVRSEFRSRARVVERCEAGARAAADEGRLVQVLVNLLLNAAQAIAPGEPEANEVRIEVARSGDGVVVRVADTGCGMSADVLARIFDPFFTTKPQGVGTGLGLSICHGIVASFGGRIEVDSAPGAGSTFEILLPAASDAAASAPRPAAPPAAPPAPASLRRVLVVDDEPAVGRAVGRALRGICDVTVETSAAAAIERARAGDRWDLVLLDVHMPEMLGPDLAEALAALDASLGQRTTFMTGGVSDAALAARVERRPVLEKPLDVDLLRALVRGA
jgi:PAS domain S-box-containing protein